MLDLRLVSIDEEGKEVIIKSNTYENEDEAREQYNKLTEEYADQSLPFFGDDEQLIKIVILQTGEEEVISECYFEFSDDLKGDLYQRI